ncbi:ATP-binding protein [Candidatus Symbiobacter mobilis]|uniref:hybrid sensor histidine kinase/response regulator n=1 Tax=Candidatus Symbiobacter mobilis TaxID=1436290 RepID=UPI001EE66AAD|nr:ATP-binding protein [Candidatus Symbiobacter mobilis]
MTRRSPARPQPLRRARSAASATPVRPGRLVDELRRYQAELRIQNQALRFSQADAEAASERFATLFAHVPLALMVVDERTQVLQHNARALALFRPLESDPPLVFLLPFVEPGMASQVEQGIECACREGASVLHELTFLSGIDGRFTGDLHIACFDDAEQPSLVCAIIDQSPLLEQRRALQANQRMLTERNEALGQSQAQMAAIIDSSLDAIVSVDERLCISVCNPAAQSLFDCGAAQAIGRGLDVFLPTAAQALRQGEVEQTVRLGEMDARTLDGVQVPVEVSVSRQRNPDVATLFLRDLRMSKELERRRAVLEAQLLESQKMQAIGTLAGGIAHDFNNIIAAILGNVALAMQDAGNEGPVGVSLAEIDRAARRARDLVRQILTFSRHEPPRRCSVMLARIVQDAARLFHVTLPPHIQLRQAISSEPLWVMADATQIEQALLNLCTNAMHAIGDHAGYIAVELEADHGASPPQALLRVRDTGSGIDPETLQRIFEPFFTTKPVGQGTGLGLSVVHGIMQSHSGNIAVRSAPGEGSEFVLRFPLCAQAPVAQAPAVATASAARRTGHRVMYVDDDEALVFLVQRALRRRGYIVTTYGDPKDALVALGDDSNHVDLLVTDFNMPGYSGVELIRDALRIRPALPVALASGYVSPDIERDALAAGARALLHKPNDIDELCAAMQALLDG